MSKLTQTSLPLPLPSQDKRPLPEIVSDGNPDPETGWPAFPLAYRDVDGKRYYAVQDWIRGVAQPADARKFWDAMKRRLNKAGIELSTWCRQLPYRASNGKKYDIDHTDAEGLYGITQRMDVNTGLRERILAFLRKSGVKIDDYRIDPDQALDELRIPPEKKIESAIRDYRRMGKSDRWIAVRMQSVAQRKRFTSAFRESLRVDPSSYQYSDITNVLRIALWRRTTQQLRDEMGLDSDANLRDYETETALIYEMLAENLSEVDLRRRQGLELDEAKQIVRSDSEFVGKQAKAAGQRLGIDLVTGRPLLPAKTKR